MSRIAREFPNQPERWFSDPAAVRMARESLDDIDHECELYDTYEDRGVSRCTKCHAIQKDEK